MKFVFLPPQSDPVPEWLPRLRTEVPGVAFVAPETDADALRELADADAAFGTMTPELLAAAGRLRWLQAPAAAPPAGFYFPELIAHPALVTNFREIYNDHLSHHILALMLAFAKQLHRYRDLQRRRLWEPLGGVDGGEIFLPDTSAVIVGLGGVGTETARLCKELGMRIVAADARRTEAPPWVDELHPPERLDALLGGGDFVILTIPHTPRTEGLFDAAKFRLMKDSAIFINVGRGMTTRLDDLDAALARGPHRRCRPRRIRAGAAAARSPPVGRPQHHHHPARSGSVGRAPGRTPLRHRARQPAALRRRPPVAQPGGKGTLVLVPQLG